MTLRPRRLRAPERSAPHDRQPISPPCLFGGAQQLRGDRDLSVEWMAFAAIFTLPRFYFWTPFPTGSFLALRQTFSWCYMPSTDRLRSAPATTGILTPRGNDVTNPVNTGIYARRRKSFFRKGRGAPGAFLASLYLIILKGLTVPIAGPLSCKIGIFYSCNLFSLSARSPYREWLVPPHCWWHPNRNSAGR
jgi:hypothetical protein